MLNHANLLSVAEGFAAAEDIRPRDEHLSYSADGLGRQFGILACLHLWVGFTISFPKSRKPAA